MAEASPGVICASLEGLLDLDPGLGLPSVRVTACRGNIGLTKKSDFHRIFLANQYMIWETLLYSGLPWWLRRKESTRNVGNLGSISGLGRSPGEGNSYPLQYSCLENPKDRGARQATVHTVARGGPDWANFTHSLTVPSHCTHSLYNSPDYLVPKADDQMDWIARWSFLPSHNMIFYFHNFIRGN